MRKGPGYYFWKLLSLAWYAGGALLLLMVMVLGFDLILSGNAELRLGGMPVTPLRELPALTGKGEVVRIQATATGEPPVVTRNGELLAYQWLRVWHSTGSSTRNSMTIDYEGYIPRKLQVSDETGIAQVDPRDVLVDLLPTRFQGSLDADGRLPAEAQGLLVPGLNELPTRPRAGIRICTLPVGKPLTVVGTVELEDGKPVLKRPPGNRDYFISALPFPEVVRRTRGESIAKIVWGTIMLVGVPGTMLFLRVRRKQKARKLGLPG